MNSGKELQKTAGIHPVSAIADETGFFEGDVLYIARMNDDRIQKIIKKAERSRISIKRISYKEMNQLWGSKNHQGILLFRKGDFHLNEFDYDYMEKEEGLYVALDGVQDPANVGAIARSMVAFGAKGLVVPKKRSAPVGESALKSSAGGLFKLPVFHVGGISNFLLKASEIGFYIVGTSLNGELLSQKSVEEILERYTRIVLVMGSEEKGISPLVEKRCDITMKLPQSGKIDSLNVSASAAVFLYEFLGRFLKS